jgi:hypothetical protein
MFVPDYRCGAVPASHRIPSCDAQYIGQTNNGLLYIELTRERQGTKPINYKKYSLATSLFINHASNLFQVTLDMNSCNLSGLLLQFPSWQRLIEWSQQTMFKSPEGRFLINGSQRQGNHSFKRKAPNL